MYQIKILKEILRIKNNKKKFKILLIGLAYKKNIDDYRESPSLYILDKLLKKKDKSKLPRSICKSHYKNRHYPNLC